MQLFWSTYRDNFIVVALDGKSTHPIRVEKGVLQGDPSSPLLFNLCFNTLMLTLDQPVYRKLGFSWRPKQNRQQRAWLQFADDAAITAADNASAQALLNVLLNSYRPDIAVVCADSIYVLELTVCHATNVIHSHEFKINKHMGLLWQEIGKLFPISFKFLLWVSLLMYWILLRV